MNKYKVTFYIRREVMAAIEVWANDEDYLWEFISRTYPNTSWEFELADNKGGE